MDLFIPRSVGELEAAVKTAAVGESAYLDFKRELAMTAGGRKAVAKDIAAFSVDGGVIVFGVDEPSPGVFELAPQDLRGWREWVDQVALHGVQPSVRVTTVPLERDDGSGYLVVVVPPSARAPHMAGERYWRRSETTNTTLTDAEVRALWRRNLDRRADAMGLVHAEIARDPTPPEARDTARLVVVAQPISADPRLLLDAVPSQNLPHWVTQLAQMPVYQERRRHSPGFHETSQVSRRAFGAARSSYYVGPDREVRDNGSQRARAKDLVDYEMREDGGIRVLYGRASDHLSDGREVVMLELIIGEVATVVELMRLVADVAGFRGSWTVGVGVVGLKSVPAFRIEGTWHSSPPFSEDEYHEVGEFSWADLHQSGSPVLEGLLGRLARALNEDNSPLGDSDVFAITEADA